MALLDTGVLLRVASRSDPLNSAARRATARLRRQGEPLHYFLQNMAEFWNTATRPPSARGGFDLSPAEANERARTLEKLFTHLPDPPGLYDEWRRLVVTSGVSGAQVHDARLVAACLASGITHIVTFNGKDFQRYTPAGIVVIDPAAI